ncbi:WD-40 repeat protein, partial [Reticulomyxa filosa]
KDGVNNIAFSADGRKVVSASDYSGVQIWDVESRKLLQTFERHINMVFAARFLPDEHTIVSCSRDGTIRLWDVNAGTEIITFKRGLDIVWDVNFSPDGMYIVADRHSKPVLNTQFSYDGKMIVSSTDETIYLWDIESGEILKQFKGHSNSVIRVKFSPDDKFIVSCSRDNTVRIWNIETGMESNILNGHSSDVLDITYFPDDQTIASCSDDTTIRLWNIESGKEIQKLKGHHRINCIDVSQNGNKIVSAFRKIEIWGL